MDKTRIGITVSDEAIKKAEEAQAKKIEQPKKEPKKTEKKKEVKDAQQESD